MSEQKWVRSSLRSLSKRLTDAGHPVSPPTVGRLLTDLNYALRVNAKKLEARSDHADRDTQFSYIAAQRQVFLDAALPIISVDQEERADRQLQECRSGLGTASRGGQCS
jgi:hypothetical protein